MGLCQPAGGLSQLVAAVAASQGLEHAIVEALAPQAHPVHARGEIAGEAALIEAGRIQLQADLRPGDKAESLAQAAQQCVHLGRGEHGGGAATQVHRAECWARR